MNRTKYQRPAPPDMLANGNPKITILRTTRARQVATEDDPQITRPALRHPKRTGRMVALMLLGGLIILGGALVWSQGIVPKWNALQNQWHYGDSKITQFDGNVGHGGTSHFLAEYYQGAIVVIEIPERDPNNAHIYTLTGMDGGDGDTIIQLSTQPGKIPGKPDLLIQAQGSAFTTILYNTGTAFQKGGNA